MTTSTRLGWCGLSGDSEINGWLEGLDPGTTKNGEGRTVYLTPELKGLLGAQMERVDRLSKRTKTINLYVFPHLASRSVTPQNTSTRL